MIYLYLRCESGYEEIGGDASQCRDTDECAIENGGCDQVNLFLYFPNIRESFYIQAEMRMTQQR